jgi:hypothetical protein
VLEMVRQVWFFGLIAIGVSNVTGLNPWDWTIKVRVMDRGVKGY